MLQVTDLVCGYSDIIAVHGISLSLAQGQTMALVGPNGAGKTSFLMALAGHIQPQSGQITLDGRNINSLGAAQRCEEGIGLVPEGRRIFPDLSVMENLIVGGYSRPQRDQSSSLDRVFDIFPRLHDRQKQLAGSLSGGEQQMLAFGRAMMSQPRLMLVDELSLGLMPSVVDECYAALEKLVTAGIAVILVDQNSDAALDFCSSAIILESGHMSWSGVATDAPASLTH